MTGLLSDRLVALEHDNAVALMLPVLARKVVAAGVGVQGHEDDEPTADAVAVGELELSSRQLM